MIRLDQKFQHHPQVVTTELDPTEAVLLHLDNQRYYTLNETGWFIWKCLGEGLDLSQISQKLQEKFDVDSNKAEQSLIKLIEELQTQKLVKALNDKE